MARLVQDGRHGDEVALRGNVIAYLVQHIVERVHSEFVVQIRDQSLAEEEAQRHDTFVGSSGGVSDVPADSQENLT